MNLIYIKKNYFGLRNMIEFLSLKKHIYNIMATETWGSQTVTLYLPQLRMQTVQASSSPHFSIHSSKPPHSSTCSIILYHLLIYSYYISYIILMLIIYIFFLSLDFGYFCYCIIYIIWYLIIFSYFIYFCCDFWL